MYTHVDFNSDSLLNFCTAFENQKLLQLSVAIMQTNQEAKLIGDKRCKLSTSNLNMLFLNTTLVRSNPKFGLPSTLFLHLPVQKHLLCKLANQIAEVLNSAL